MYQELLVLIHLITIVFMPNCLSHKFILPSFVVCICLRQLVCAACRHATKIDVYGVMIEIFDVWLVIIDFLLRKPCFA